MPSRGGSPTARRRRRTPTPCRPSTARATARRRAPSRSTTRAAEGGRGAPGMRLPGAPPLRLRTGTSRCEGLRSWRSEMAEREMAETVEPVDVSPDGDEPAEQGESPSVTELVVQLGRDLSVLALCEAQLQASRNMPEVRRAVRDLAAALLVVVALAAAVVFANVAAFEGLSTAVSGRVAA